MQFNLKNTFGILACCFLGACSTVEGQKIAQESQDVSSRSNEDVKNILDVKWHPFSQKTFEKAALEGKLVVVTVETSWCHWCHVMEQNVWPNVEIKRILNENYVAIRVNADENPDVGERFSAWGWPATVILNADGKQLIAVRGYKEPRIFLRIFTEISSRYKEGVLDDNFVSFSFLKQKRKSLAGGKNSVNLAKGRLSWIQLLAQLDAYYDEKAGGWGRPQKYPLRPPILISLLRDEGEERSIERNRAQFSLEGYSQLQDPIAGGVFQYSVRGDWQHAHTEKLGHLQAELIHAFVDGKQAGFLGMVGEAQQVARYVLQVLQNPKGGFYANQDADVRAGEKILLAGPKYYALNEDERKKYTVPPVQKEIFASQNGALIAALLRLWQEDGDERWRIAAEKALDFAEKHLQKNEGFLHVEIFSERGVENAETKNRFLLDDQVYMLRAYLAHYLATGAKRSRIKMLRLANFILENFQLETGGMRALVDNSAPLFMQTRMPFHANARLARLFLQMAKLDAASDDDKTRFRAAANVQIELLSEKSRAVEEGRTVGTLLLAKWEQLERGLHVSVVGRSFSGTKELREAARRYGGLETLVEFSEIGLRFSEMGKPAAFVCSSSSCSMPAFDVESLRAVLMREKEAQKASFGEHIE